MYFYRFSVLIYSKNNFHTKILSFFHNHQKLDIFRVFQFDLTSVILIFRQQTKDRTVLPTVLHQAAQKLLKLFHLVHLKADICSGCFHSPVNQFESEGQRKGVKLPLIQYTQKYFYLSRTEAVAPSCESKTYVQSKQ